MKSDYYTPAHMRAKSTSKQLGDHLDTIPDLQKKIDIITLVGTMTKEEKAFYTNIFCLILKAINIIRTSCAPPVVLAMQGLIHLK